MKLSHDCVDFISIMEEEEWWFLFSWNENGVILGEKMVKIRGKNR